MSTGVEGRPVEDWILAEKMLDSVMKFCPSFGFFCLPVRDHCCGIFKDNII